MTDLKRYENGGIEIFVDTMTGESCASVSGYARMANKDKSTISRRLGRVAESTVKTAEIETVTGIKTVALVTEDMIAEWLPKDNPIMATQLMKLGVRAFMHTIAGYNVTTTAVQEFNLPKSFGEALRMLADTVDELESTQKQLSSAETTIDTYRAIVNEEVALTFKQIADALKIKGLGRNNLMKFLREVFFLVKDKSCAPRHEQIEAERAIVVTKTYEIKGDTQTSQSTKVTFKGLTWILNKLRERNYPVNTTARVIWDTYNKPEADEELLVESKREQLNLLDFVV